MRVIDNTICEIKIYNKDYQKIRKTINEKNNIAINIDKKDIKDLKKNIIKQTASWDIICASMDRLEDTVEYLNGFCLKYNQNQRQAFDFYELLNNIYIVINCIEELYKIFSSDLADINELKKRNSIFKEFNNNEITQKEYTNFSIAFVNKEEFILRVEKALKKHVCSATCGKVIYTNSGYKLDGIDVGRMQAL